MAVYGQMGPISAVSRDAYEAEMTFRNPETDEVQKRTGTFNGLNYNSVTGVEDAVWRNLAQYIVGSGCPLEGYYLESAIVRRVDVIYYLQGPDTSA
jgi:hypothetical protein